MGMPSISNFLSCGMWHVAPACGACGWLLALLLGDSCSGD